MIGMSRLPMLRLPTPHVPRVIRRWWVLGLDDDDRQAVRDMAINWLVRGTVYTLAGLWLAMLLGLMVRVFLALGFGI